MKKLATLALSVLMLLTLMIPSAFAEEGSVQASYEKDRGIVSICAEHMTPNQVYDLISVRKADTVLGLGSDTADADGRLTAEIPVGPLADGTYQIHIYRSSDGTVAASGLLKIGAEKPVDPGHGGGGGGISAPAFGVQVVDSTNGAISVTPDSAEAGSQVTVTVQPDSGYQLSKLTVIDKNGNAIRVSGSGGRYTFTMPESRVTVEAAFRMIAGAFTDVPADSYFAGAVDWAVSRGITSGRTETTFDPFSGCTRAQAVTFLWRAAGSPTPGTLKNNFKDVPADAYFHDAVLWAVENHITNGTTKTTFAPNETCTRAQIVTFMWRAEEAPGVGEGTPFVDVSADAYFHDAVLWAVQSGVTAGKTSNTFAPSEMCTRAQIVTFLYRHLAK